jgi:hypothetical protein
MAVDSGHRLISEGGHPALKAPVGKAEAVPTIMPLTDPDAPTTQDAFIRVIDKTGMAVIDGQVAEELAEAFGVELDAEVASYLL